jgi:archaellum component FlaD/FlaE
MGSVRDKLKGELGWLGKKARSRMLRILKGLINRQERRRAKQNPECQLTYRRKIGYAD